MNKLEDKYIDFLLKRCLNFKNSKVLFISAMIHDEFLEKVVRHAFRMGIEEIYISNESLEVKHDILKKITLEDISSESFFDRSIWDKYALRGASFLILQTEMPGLMDDISSDKLSKARYVERITRPIYKKLQGEFKIPWCIANVPNKIWAKALFPDLSEEDAFNKLFYNICYMCMIDRDDPINSWNSLLDSQNRIMSELNSLEIRSLHYRNSIGTDLDIELDRDALWQNAGSLGEDMIVNMPTYEIFTTPVFYGTNGIVYSSKPLFYGGGKVSDFWISFKNGRVVSYGAKKGEDLLGEIINTDYYSSYLGEVALVNYDSPISNTGLVFQNTTIDENASCHLALGSGFAECIRGGDDMSGDELLRRGVNPSKNHVDFMIGTSDLEIEASTNRGKVLILKNGNINL